MKTSKGPKRDNHESDLPRRALRGEISRDCEEDCHRLAVPLGPLVDFIRKAPHDYGVRPNLTDYENARARFRWSDVPALCEGMGPSRCNIADTAIDRHAAGPAARRTAFRFVSDKGWDGAIATRDLSYVELRRLAKRPTP
jgi:hypothetical protein